MAVPCFCALPARLLLGPLVLVGMSEDGWKFGWLLYNYFVRTRQTWFFYLIRVLLYLEIEPSLVIEDRE